MKKAEINMVVTDSSDALRLYSKIFDIENINKTDLQLGQNEVFFDINGMHFHLLDENEEFGLIAPKKDMVTSCWFNITVKDINKTFDNATKLGCEVVMPVAFVESHNLYQAMFKDKFSYMWLINQEKIK